jgi:hypothetical protein
VHSKFSVNIFTAGYLNPRGYLIARDLMNVKQPVRRLIKKINYKETVGDKNLKF